MRSSLAALPRWNSHQPAPTTMMSTRAVRTARLVCIGASSLASFLHRRARFPLCFAALDRLTLVVRFLAFGQADRHLDAPVLQVHPHRDERHAALDRLADQLADFLAVQQQLAAPRR